MKRSALIAFLILSWTVVYSQFIPNTSQKRAILKDHAELVELRGIVALDSAQIDNLTRAYYFKDSALRYSQIANRESDRIGQEWHSAYVLVDSDLTKARKEVKRQRFWKIIAFAVAGIVVILR